MRLSKDQEINWQHATADADGAASPYEGISVYAETIAAIDAELRATRAVVEAAREFKAANDEVRRMVVIGGAGSAAYHRAVDAQQAALPKLWDALAALDAREPGAK